MSEIKFACSACGQHLACDSSYIGRQIPCPACQATIDVPAWANPPPVPAAMPSSSSAAPPFAGAASATSVTTAPTPRQPTGTSGLAVASLICSCAGLLFGFLGTIPGFILGFKALGQIKRTPGLGGKGLATASLICAGVLTVLWIPLTFILAMGILGGVRAVTAMKNAPVQVQASGTRDGDITTDLAPDPAGWMPELEGVSIPEAPVSGRLQGYTFIPEDVELNGAPQRNLVFSREVSTAKGQETFRLAVEFDEDDAATYSGRTITVARDGAMTVQPSTGWNSHEPPRFDMFWVDPGTGPARERMHITSPQPYPSAMRLEFGQLKDGKIPGRIYLCILDKKKSFLRGKFVADVTQIAAPGSAGPLSAAHRPGETATDTNPDTAGWTLNLDACNDSRCHGHGPGTRGRV